MLNDFDRTDSPVPGHADVCIVGAGAVGILLATQLAAAGRRVTLLEGGGRVQEDKSQEIYRSELGGLHHHGVHDGRFRTYGGTTTQWGGQILELDSFDFEPREHVPGSGWPFPKSTLTPFYERALDFAGLRRVERDNEAVRRSLGLKALNPGREFQTLYSRWCPERNFAVLHSRELSGSRKLSVLTHANVVELVLNEGGAALQGVRVRGFSGREAFVTADHFVLCLGGVETTRLLLQPAATGTVPWQANGVLGRHFQDHIALNGIPIRVTGAQPPFDYFGHRFARGFEYHAKIQLTQAEQSSRKTLNVAGTINPFRVPDADRARAKNALRDAIRAGKRPGLDVARHVPGIAAEVLDYRIRGDAPAWKQTMLTVHSEQLPLSASSIGLSDEKDSLGLRRTRLNWQISEEEIHTIRTYVRVATGAFHREGLGIIDAPRGFYEDDALVRSMCSDSYHHIGGTRMSEGVADGVVDPQLRLHGVANGYVCSSSVFPCSGFSNPTHTVLALAMRLSDDLVTATAGTAEVGLPLLAPAPAPTDRMRDVTVPGMTRSTSQLGFGCAYLLGPGLDQRKSRRILDACYDAGIRHFDVARLYGAGKTEAFLGEFLRDHPDATVTTKYGVIPPTTAWRAIQMLQRRVPGLSRTTPYLKRNDKAQFTAAEARESLELSLRLLGRDHIDVFLLHEPEVGDLVHDDLLAFLEERRRAGVIGNFGIGGEYRRVAAFHRQQKGYTPVLQFEASIFGPQLDLPGVSRIHYRTFARPTDALGRRFAADPGLARRWSEAVNADLFEPIVLSRLLLKASLEAFPDSLTLFSTRSEEHVLENAQVAADSKLLEPARKLIDLVRADDLGIGRELYESA